MRNQQCNDMYESPRWTPTMLMIDIKRRLFKKVIKYWLRLIEAPMALMRFPKEKSLELNISKYMYNTCTFQNMTMNSFDNYNTTKTPIECNFLCIVTLPCN